MKLLIISRRKSATNEQRKMKKEYVSKERRRIEKELLYYLRKYRFFASRFRDIRDFDSIINDIIEQLKSDI